MNIAPKHLTILLVISLILNVFLIGLGAGIWYGKSKHKGHFFNAIEQEYKRLPPELRKSREASFNEKRKVIRENRQKTVELREQLHEAFIQETLDIPKIESLFVQIRELKGQGMKSAQDAMLETVKDMPLEARKKFVQKLQKRSKRKRGP